MSAWQIHECDCADVIPTLTAERVVLITDPPYGVDLGIPKVSASNGGLARKGSGQGRKGHGLAHAPYASHDDSYESFVGRVVPRLNAAIDGAVRGAVFTGPHIHEQRKPNAIGGIFCGASQARMCWGFKSFLPVLFYGGAPELNRGSYPTAIASSETSDRDEATHTVPKPIGWMLWLVRLASRPGDVIFDPFCGSGTTGVAALRLGRSFIGCEIDPAAAANARARLLAEEADTTVRAARAGQVALFTRSGS